jgi:hypothetical protein
MMVLLRLLAALAVIVILVIALLAKGVCLLASVGGNPQAKGTSDLDS